MKIHFGARKRDFKTENAVISLAALRAYDASPYRLPSRLGRELNE